AAPSATPARSDLPCATTSGTGRVTHSPFGVGGADQAATPGPNGYVEIQRSWRTGDRIELVLPMEPRFTASHPRVESTRGTVAIERGPVVYCLEQCDQPTVDVLDAWIDVNEPL